MWLPLSHPRMTHPNRRNLFLKLFYLKLLATIVVSTNSSGTVHQNELGTMKNRHVCGLQVFTDRELESTLAELPDRVTRPSQEFPVVGVRSVSLCVARQHFRCVEFWVNRKTN